MASIHIHNSIPSRAMWIWLQNIIPQKGLSRFVGWLSRLEAGILTQWAIRWFVRYYQVDMSQAAKPNMSAYKSFNQFFTRALNPRVRKITKKEGILVSPADGTVSGFGRIDQGTLLPLKGHSYSLQSLLGGFSSLVQLFELGSYLAIYLSPKDYHRVHMPLWGTLRQMVYVPGSLFSVNQKVVKTIPGLFTRNERVMMFFETAWGNMAVIMIGAMLVGNIEVSWHGQVNPTHDSCMKLWTYLPDDIQLSQGEELGRFNMGSTVVVLVDLQTQWKFLSGLTNRILHAGCFLAKSESF